MLDFLKLVIDVIKNSSKTTNWIQWRSNMTKKNTSSFGEHVEEKQKIEDQLKSIRAELHSVQFDSGRIARLGMEAGDAKARLESYKHQHGEGGKIQERHRSEYNRLESVLNEAIEKVTSAKAKRCTLEAEEADLERLLLDMRYQFMEGELVTILKAHQLAETRKTDLLKLIAEHQDNKETTQQALIKAKSAVGLLRNKRRDVLAGMATGANKASTPLDKVDLDIEKATTVQNAAQQSLTNTEDTIAGLQGLLIEAEQKAKTQRAEAQEAVCLYLVDRANIIGDRYSKTAAQLGQYFAEMQALAKVLDDVSGGSFPEKITAFSDHRLYIPAFSINTCVGALGIDGLLDPSQVDIHPAIEAEKQTLREMGFTYA